MEIKTIAVIGAGPLGRVIAALAVLGEFATVLEDVNSETIEHALAAIRLRLDDSIRSGQLGANDRDVVMSRLTTSRSIEEAMRAAELIIETTVDELETKLEIFLFSKINLHGRQSWVVAPLRFRSRILLRSHFVPNDASECDSAVPEEI